MADIIDIDVVQNVTSVSFEVEPNTNIININKVTGGGGGAVPSLQEVTDVDASTTNSITANSFIKTGGTSSQFLKANGSIDSNIYGIDSNLVHKVGVESISGLKTFTTAIFANANTEDAVTSTSSKGIGIVATTASVARPAAIFNQTNSGSIADIIEINKAGVEVAKVTYLGEFSGAGFIKTGGTSSQILAADGSVITAGNNITITGGQISSVGGAGGGGSSVNYYLNGGTSQGTFGGTTYYEFSKVAVIGTEADFNISSNGYIASFITDVADPSLLLIPTGNWNLEFFFSSSSAGGSPSFYTELYKYDGTTFTLVASSSVVPEGITGGTSIDAYFTSLAVPETVLTVNDRLAIRVFVNTSGKTITLHTQNGHLCEVITTFTAGLTALNGLQAQVQNFSTGTTGTDFAINSSGSTHTFNLPSASASARGVVTTGSQTFAGDKTFTGNTTANSFIKTGGTSSQFLKADGSIDSNTYLTSSNAVLLTGNQTIDGTKTFTNTSPLDKKIVVNNSSSGDGLHSNNTSTGNGILAWNLAAGTGIRVDNAGTGFGIFTYNGTSGIGNSVFNDSTGKGINIYNASSGTGLYCSTAGTGLNYVGANNGTTTFSVDKFGNTTANSFIKTGGTSSQFLMADGSTSTGGGGATPTLQDVTTAGAVTTNKITVNVSDFLPSIIANNTNGLGIFASSDNGIVGRFNLDTAENASNIVEFQKNGVNQAYVTHNGTIVSNELLVNTTTDNGVDKLQVNGTASGSAATLSNQFVIKSQLDLKANNNEVSKLIVNEFPNSIVNGTTSDTLLSTFTIPAGTLPTSCMPDIRMKFSKSGDGGTAQMRLRINTVNNFATSTQIATYTAALATDTFLVSRNPVISGGNMNIFIATTATQSDTSAVAITESNFTIDVANTIYLFVSVTQGVAGDTTTLKAFKIIN